MVFATQKQNEQQYQADLAKWRNNLTHNKNGVTLGDLHQIFKLDSEPQASLSLQTYGNPVITHKDDGTANLFWTRNTNTSGVIVVATYSNLTHSLFTDKYGITHRIAKIVRTFSNLNQYYTDISQGFADWALSTSWQTSSTYGHGYSGLQISINPANGATFTNATTVTVADKYYDENGKQIDPTGGFYVFSSLNHSDVSDDKADIEGVRGTGLRMTTIAGSSVDVQPNGALQASSSNKTGDNYSWDKYDSPDFYLGSGLGYITNSNPSMTFYVSSAPEKDNSYGSYWFTINTQMPSAPVQRKTTAVHYHYDKTFYCYIKVLS